MWDWSRCMHNTSIIVIKYFWILWYSNRDGLFGESKSSVDCRNNKIYFIDDIGHKIILVGMNRGVSLRFISSFQFKKKV
jgi:hypothetical protein